MVAIEGAQGADGLVDGGVLQLPLLAQGDEEVEDFVFAELGGITVRESLVVLTYPVEIGGPGAGRTPTEINVAFEVAPPLLRLDHRGLAGTVGTGGELGCLCCFFSSAHKEKIVFEPSQG